MVATRGWKSILMVALIAGILASSAFGEEPRTLKSKVTPQYPELAKKMNVNGVVRVELVVAPSGQVKSAKALGGHPLLIDAAVNAAKQFKYAAGPEETKEVVPFNFTTGQ